jgi:hypothetical protein
MLTSSTRSARSAVRKRLLVLRATTHTFSLLRVAALTRHITL